MKFIIFTITAGIFGFILSSYILFSIKGGSNIFEFSIENRKDKIVDLLNNRINVLKNRSNKIKTTLEGITASTTKISSSKRKVTEKKIKILEDSLKETKATLINTIKERNELFLVNPDTSYRYYTKFLSIDRNKLLNFFADKSSENSLSEDSVKVYIIDPLLINAEENHFAVILDSTYIKKSPITNKIDFIDKYPSLGLWFVLTISQTCIWFIILSFIINLIFQSKEDNDKKLNIYSILLYVLFVALVIGCFTFITYNLLIDKYILSNNLFIINFKSKMKLFSIIGYSITSVCFITYLILAHNILALRENAKDNNDHRGISEVDKKKENKDQEKINELIASFNNSFTCSAIILSVFVIWLGTLFKAINSIEIFDFYNQISNKYFMNNDFVFLVGLLHSVLLLIFYLPVRLNIDSIKHTEQEAAAEDTSWYNKLFGGILKDFSPILLTASPLITSIVQSLSSYFTT